MSKYLKIAALPGIFLLTGCAAVNDSAVCSGLSRFVDAHNEALLTDGGDRSVVTGAALIAAYDAGCAK